MSQFGTVAVIMYVIWSLTMTGVLYDGPKWAWLAELVRYRSTSLTKVSDPIFGQIRVQGSVP